MIIDGVRFRHMEERPLRDGRKWLYWCPPPGGARKVFQVESLGEKLDPEALKKYADREISFEQWKKECQPGAAAGPRYGTIDWLIENKYQGSSRWPNNEKTAGDYKNKLMMLRNYRLENGDRFGDHRWTDVDADVADDLYKKLCWNEDGESRPAMGGAIIRQARIVWNYASHFIKDEKAPLRNPWNAPRIKKLPPRAVSWTHKQVLAYLEAAERVGRISVGMTAAICYDLGQRPIEARLMKRTSFIGNSTLKVVQSKTNRQLFLPTSPLMSEWVAKIPADQHQLVINEKNGKPYADHELSKAAAEVREAAKLPSHLLIMDLRRTCLTGVGLTGATDDQLVSISGHQDRAMLEVYSLKLKEKAEIALTRWWATRGAA